jgi:hypothetical protein
MTGQPRLWVTAVEAAHIQLLWEWHHGWSAHIKMRRQGDGWDATPATFYGALSTEELYDVLVTELARMLGLEEV